MKKLLPLALLIALVFPNQVTGQEYMQAGIRTGFRGGIFFQMPSYSGNKEIAYNAMLGFNNHGIQITGLRIIYETSISEISSDLYFAWGYGGHAGFILTDKIYYYGDRYNFPEKRCYPVFGVDGWAAAEYRFREIPLIISLNLKPYVELSIPTLLRIMPIDLGISASYVF